MILKDNFFGMLGFAVRSGNVALGAVACDKGVKSGKVALILLDDGASERTKKDTRNMCKFYEVPMIIAEPAGMMSQRCGRAGLMIVGVTDGRFAKRLLEIAESENAEV